MLGGALGAAGRFLCQYIVQTYTRWPGWIAIFIVNGIGSFWIGFLVSYLSTDLRYVSLLNASPTLINFDPIIFKELAVYLAIGFCGAFTTFSTFSLDTVILLHTSRVQAFINAIGSIIFAYGAVLAGWCLGGGICL